ncbi:hypothetical protein [Candidatus Phytoplasma meliae]|uniref:Uncharacterized protein n=1 Tax=Candidatus Phytoplasma meliae TaxID=1848402 RepID=A0ABS5CXE3_9MOLU|nr:hypothetical protein [Candidatus Phytoplasma meliae]MBP5835640.1 hypothetical protein [Candidatus Phytoplasma meliae]
MQNQPQLPTHSKMAKTTKTTTCQKPFIKKNKNTKNTQSRKEKQNWNFKKKHFKIIFILTTIALILLLNKILFYSQPSIFTKTQTDPISITSTDESKEIFRTNMLKTKVHHINIQNRNQIPEILKRAEIPFEATHYFNNRPSYNEYSMSYVWWYLKEPPNGLIHTFFTPRQNPFGYRYPRSDDKYTIQDLLQHDIAFEEAWLFYDVSTQPTRTDCKIHNIDLDINLNNHTIGQEIKNKLKTETKLTELELTNYRDQIVRQEVNKYLLSNKIIKSELREIMPNHMNVAPNCSISFPFNQNDTTKTNFCLYFDDGFRAFDADTTIDTLLKLSNDAKNGYLFNVKINLDYSTYQTRNSIEQLLPTNYLTNRDTIKINLTNRKIRPTGNKIFSKDNGLYYPTELRQKAIKFGEETFRWFVLKPGIHMFAFDEENNRMTDIIVTDEGILTPLNNNFSSYFGISAKRRNFLASENDCVAELSTHNANSAKSFSSIRFVCDIYDSNSFEY